MTNAPQNLLRLDPLTQIHCELSGRPFATIQSLIGDAVGKVNHGVPDAWRRLVLHHVPTSTLDVLRPLATPGGRRLVPDCLCPLLPGWRQDIDQEVERVQAVERETLAACLVNDYGTPLPQRWQRVLDDTDRWLVSYTTILRAVWDAFRPIWRRVEPLLRRETERVGAAIIRGDLEAVLTGYNPRCRYRDGTLRLPATSPASFELAGRKLVLIPIASGIRACLFSPDHDEFVFLGYPLPGLGFIQGHAPVHTHAEDALALLIGQVRSEILQLLRTPLTMGEISDRSGCSPAGASYHCAQLEAAGLITRSRAGRSVHVIRTERGSSLIDLLT